MSFTVTTISTLILAICLIKFIVGRKKKKYHPIAGTIFNQILNFNRLHDYLTDLACTHRTYRSLSFFSSEIYTSDPANVEHILKTNFAKYGKHLKGSSRRWDIHSGWREMETAEEDFKYEFSTKMLRDFSSGVFRTIAAKLARIVSEATNSNQTIEVQDLFMKSTLDSVFKVILGVELDSMCGTNEEGTRFSNSFDEASAITLFRYADVFWRIKRFLNIESEAKLKENIKLIDKYIFKLIRTKTEQVFKSQNNSSVKQGDVLSRFLELNNTDPKYLKDIILSFTIAGKDTTASTLSWFFYMLSKNPIIQEKIAEEVKRATNLHENPSFEELAMSVTEEALDKLQYLHATLTETLRLHPAVPLDGKICLSDDTLPDGYSVNKGDIVAYQPYAMGRMKFLWGDDAEEFRPERWLNEDGIFQQESPFKFTAFQAGPRICLGKEFAYRQMKIFSAVLIGSFIFKLSDEQKDVKYRTMLTLQIDGGLHLRAFHRSGHKSSIDA